MSVYIYNADIYIYDGKIKWKNTPVICLYFYRLKRFCHLFRVHTFFQV